MGGVDIMPFFLLLIGLTLIMLNIKGIKREKNSFTNMLQAKEMDTTETEVMIGELRREFSETILELQKEILELRKSLDKSDSAVENFSINLDNKIPLSSEQIGMEDKNKEEKIFQLQELDNISINEMEYSSSEDDDSGRNNSIKIDEIGKLLSENVSVEEICERLSIGKGEVLLIKELYLR